METKTCKTCGDEKDISFFSKEKRKNKINVLIHCVNCFNLRHSIVHKKYYNANKNKILIKSRLAYSLNIENEHKRALKYKKNHNEQIKNRRAKAAKNKRNIDMVFKIKQNKSRHIRRVLTQNNSSKNNLTCIKFLQYSIIELKKNIESQFESWMVWDNYGVYNSKTWNDNDQSTWTWQIDHIIPQSCLPYTSMEDENFKKCWSLENLRPYPAKQNFLDGISKIRHNRIK